MEEDKRLHQNRARYADTSEKQHDEGEGSEEEEEEEEEKNETETGALKLGVVWEQSKNEKVPSGQRRGTIKKMKGYFKRCKIAALETMQNFHEKGNTERTEPDSLRVSISDSSGPFARKRGAKFRNPKSNSNPGVDNEGSVSLESGSPDDLPRNLELKVSTRNRFLEKHPSFDEGECGKTCRRFSSSFHTIYERNEGCNAKEEDIPAEPDSKNLETGSAQGHGCSFAPEGFNVLAVHNPKIQVRCLPFTPHGSFAFLWENKLMI